MKAMKALARLSYKQNISINLPNSDDSFNFRPPLCFDLTVQLICRTTANKIVTFDLFLREQHHLGRRIPEEEQLCSFELLFRMQNGF